MGTKVNSNYEDLITFTRASRGHALRPVSYGPELANNGTFNGNADGWTGGDYDDETGDLSLVSAGSVNAYQTGFDSTKLYLLTYTVSEYTSGNISAYDGGVFGPFTNAVGTYTIVISPDVQRLGVRAQNGPVDAKISSISIKEFTFDQPDGTLTLFEHPENVPRVEYDADGNRLGLLVEEARTNNITNSESCSFVDESGGTVTASTTPAPYGMSSTVKRVQSSTLNGGGKLQVTILTGGDNYCSVYVRSRTGADQNLKITASGTSGATQVAPASGDWVRLGRVASLGAGSRDMRVLSTGDTIDLDIALPQVEFGSFPTSYMKTTNGAEDRAADVASIPVADFGLNHSSYSMLLEAISSAPDNASGTGNNSNTIAQLKRGSTNYSSLGIGSTSTRTNRPSLASRNNAATILAAGDVASLDNTFDEGLLVKFSASFDVDSGTIAGSVNGSTVFSSTNIGRVAGVDVSFLDLEFRDGQGAAYIKSIKYYPRRLTNAQLQDLTS